jgi:hypothetical protein
VYFESLICHQKKRGKTIYLSFLNYLNQISF